MTKLERVMMDPDRVRGVVMNHLKDKRNIRAILISGFCCPSEFGFEKHCSIEPDCETCWSREVTE